MGAISSESAQAPCPLFSGRGLDVRGFTLKMPEKIYLSCTTANKESERGLLSVFCYDLAETVYADTADRTAFLIYVKGGAYCNTITTGKMMHALDVLMEVDYEYTPTTDDRNAYARGARLQAYGKASMDGGIMGAYINAQLQGGFTYTGTTSVGTFAGAVGAEIRTEAMGPGTTTTVTRITTLLLWGRYMSAVSGAVTMLQIEAPWDYAAVVGNTIGIEFTKGYKYSSASETDFDIGIDLGDHCTTAIDIGAATTGINFTGDMTDCINVAVGCSPTAVIDVNGAAATILNIAVAPTTTAIVVAADLVVPEFLKIGTWGNDVVWDQADEFIEVLVETSSTTAEKPMVRLRLAGHASTAHTGDMCALQVQTYQAASNVTDMIGAMVEAGFKANGTISSGGTYGMVGLLVRCEDLDSTVTGTGNMAVLNLRAQFFDPATAFNGESTFIRINSHCDTLAQIDSIMQFEDDSPGEATIATYLFDFNATVAPWNDTNKNLCMRVTTSTYYIPTGTSTVGLSLVANYTDGILISGAGTDAIHISGAYTTAGINFGAMATAILFSGTITTSAINVAASTTVPQFLTIGTSGSGADWNTTNEFIMIYVESTTATPGTKTCAKIQLSAHDTANTTSGRLEAFRAETISVGAYTVAASMRALVGQVTFSGITTFSAGPSTYSLGCFGVIAAIHSSYRLTATGYTAPLGLFLGVETDSTLHADSSFIYIYNYGKVAPTSIMRIETPCQPSLPTYLIDRHCDLLGGNSDPFHSGDLVDTASNDVECDGYISVRVAGTAYYIPLFNTKKNGA